MAVNNPCQALLRKIQQVEFVTLELNLYLNTHPEDQKALEQYNCMHRELCELKKQYEQQYGPLLNYGWGMNTGNSWRWAEQPWPWEM
ncbi:MAG TPA: spore coat protein CotJB [Clostridia bacterium]|nr:spore coat protein CotJB [Clostridia bacterium]HHY06017.1 spore coat protein CotJB [Clostridia bacterium]